MPSAEHTHIVDAPFDEVWAFVREIDNWAPLVTGYQRHEKLSEADSSWLVKGQLGGLTRVAEFQVHIDSWDDTGHVLFSLTGINEPVKGSGSFTAERVTNDALDRPGTRSSRFTKYRNAIARRILALVFGQRTFEQVRKRQRAKEQSKLVFSLTLNAGGAAGMVMNMLLAPMMMPIAADLANGIARQIENGS